ncbi:RluA family pseudouridine synthase [Clostridium sp. BJN0001]|uniref:RluA family pseudouridine synthase n=1 Tax=Clostridium sp. BJN0001 TaxID=2930219 RepID=UPI001FD62CFF|nr:RluA family pseudouridine synthase [Clostridium sp. BJN0001]
MSSLKSTINETYNKCKLREYLKKEMGLSTRLIRRASLDKRIFLNGAPVKMNIIVNTGDIVNIDLATKETQNIVPEKMDIDIVYEDEDILIVNKEPFMVVHPTKSYQSGTLANGVLNYFIDSNQNCIVRLVSRLDMNTSGLIIIAKNQYAHGMLSKTMEKNEIVKKYIAIVHGHMENESGVIDLPIYNPKDDLGLRRIVDERGKRSITHYKVLERLNDADVVECRLETGRTHQIRVHLSHLGHPIYGDTLYGYGGDEMDLIKRQALHAYFLEFKSPRTQKLLEVKADLPSDMKLLIEKLR